MRSVDGRYPHFAYKTLEQQEESKRLFYVAISRARKRLVVSGSSADTLTPYIRTILHLFTLRSHISNNFFIEIGWNELKLSYKGQLIRHYKNISPIFDSPDIKDQFGLRRVISQSGIHIDLPDKIDEIFSTIGTNIN